MKQRVEIEMLGEVCDFGICKRPVRLEGPMPPGVLVTGINPGTDCFNGRHLSPFDPDCPEALRAAFAVSKQKKEARNVA